MLGLITPPYGLLLFIMIKIAEVPLTDIVRDVMPFLFVMIARARADHLRAGDSCSGCRGCWATRADR